MKMALLLLLFVQGEKKKNPLPFFSPLLTFKRYSVPPQGQIHTFLNSDQRHNTCSSSKKNQRPSIQLTFELLGALILPIKINFELISPHNYFLKKYPRNCINTFTAYSLVSAILIHLRVIYLCLPPRCQGWCGQRPSSGHPTGTQEGSQAPCPLWGHFWL